MRRVVLLVWLTVLWMVLWRQLSLANLVSGIAVALVVMALYPLAPTGERRHIIRPLHLLFFLAYFARELLESNFVLARTILSPTSRIRTGIVEVPLPGCSDLVTTLVANAITLTPGTMTIEVHESPRRLYVHVLDRADIEVTLESIHKLVRVALRAFCTDQTLAGIESAWAKTAMASGRSSDERPGRSDDQDGHKHEETEPS